MGDIDFIGPYATTYQGFLVREGDDSIVGKNDLAGKEICTWPGTTSAAELRKRAPGANVDQQDSASECIEELREERVDAVSTDQLILYGFAHRYADELQVVPDLTIGSPNSYGIGIAKGHREDCERIRDFLRDYLLNGDWEDDFENSLSAAKAAEPDWATEFKPDASELDINSCRDEPLS